MFINYQWEEISSKAQENKQFKSGLCLLGKSFLLLSVWQCCYNIFALFLHHTSPKLQTTWYRGNVISRYALENYKKCTAEQMSPSPVQSGNWKVWEVFAILTQITYCPILWETPRGIYRIIQWVRCYSWWVKMAESTCYWLRAAFPLLHCCKFKLTPLNQWWIIDIKSE